MSDIKPTWERDNVRLYLGDCLEVLPTLEDGSFDAVITDPPYGNNYSTGMRKNIYRPSTRVLGDRLTSPLLGDSADKIAPLLGDSAVVYWCAAPDRLDVVLPIIRNFWFVTNVLCWEKDNGTAGDLEASYSKQWEAVVYARKKRVPLVGGRDRDILRFARVASSKYVHPTQKPVPMFQYLIGRHIADRILDPFMGSGTTGVAAARLGRAFTGIELDEKYFEMAVSRISQEMDQGKLFVG